MYFKKSVFIIVLIFFSFCLQWNLSGQSREILIDKLVAVVGDTIISFSDIEKVIILYPVLRGKNVSERSFYKQILGDLINYRTIYLEYSNDLILNESDFEEIELQIINKAGSIQELNKIIESFDMTWESFRQFIKERVFFDKIIKEKFQFKISIFFNDVEGFYKNVYVPTQKTLNLIPKSLIEMTPEIENHLRKIETGKKIQSWIKDIKGTYDIKILPGL